MQGDNSKAAELLLLVAGYGVCTIMALLCILLLWKIYRNEIDLSRLISEGNGNASMSRFQLLIFTMMVAISLFILVVKNWKFPEVPDGVLTLLGISASTYAVGKGIQFSQPKTLLPPEVHQQNLDTAEKISDTGATVVVTDTGVASGGAAPGAQTPAAPQTADNGPA